MVATYNFGPVYIYISKVKIQLIALCLSSSECMENDNLQLKEWCLGQIFLVDLRDFFFRFRVGAKKSSEIDKLTGHFQVIF